MNVSRLALVGKGPILGALVLVLTISLYLLHDYVDLHGVSTGLCGSQYQAPQEYHFDTETDDAMRLLPDMFSPVTVTDDKGMFSTGEEPGSVDKLLVVAHYHENLDWLKNVPTPWRVIDKEDSRNPDCIRSNRMTEASAYLYFLIKYYHNLPTHTAFVHGHGQPEIMRGEFDGREEGSVWAGVGYRPVNVGAISSSINTRERQEESMLIWYGEAADWPDTGLKNATIVPDEIVDWMLGFYELWDFLEKDIEDGGMGLVLPRIITVKCCSTFIIDRNSVLRIPRNMLVRLLYFLEVERTYKSVGNAMEYTWILLFNQGRWPRRHVGSAVSKD